jgi:hypothetical protein
MTLNQYLIENLSSIAMLTIKFHDMEAIQYNYWNHVNHKLYLLDNTYRISHILHEANLEPQEDGSFLASSSYHPKSYIINFYFGGVSQ